MSHTQEFLFSEQSANWAEPTLSLPSSADSNIYSPVFWPNVDQTQSILTAGEIATLKAAFADHMQQLAPDLSSNHLAEHYANSLFDELTADGVSYDQLVETGTRVFYDVGHKVLGPLAVAFVHHVLSQVTSGTVIFPARDATPFYWAAKALTTSSPNAYAVTADKIINPVFNRKLWGVNDELDSASEVLPITHPLVQKLLAQMGFGSDEQVTFVEVGCWGTMVDQLKRAMQSGAMPETQFNVYFMFSHLPQIYGFLNQHAGDVSESALEAIADTWEAFPKEYTRPTALVDDDGTIKAVVDGHFIDSPFLPIWTQAALQGVVDAAIDFTGGTLVLNPGAEILKLQQLSTRAQEGLFTGVLPGHTETWSDGEAWKSNWAWGKIPPLKSGY